jgi:signal transduction histidine kinase
MYFAGFSGATTFLPEAIPEGNEAPPTVITDFRLLQTSGPPALKIAQQAISYASKITLSHKQTPFSLTFAALSYSDSQANRYRYKLEGLDNAWTEVGSDSRTVTYTGLPARKYRFRVQGATNSSQWSEPGAELEIVILPAWWNTWWFRTAYGLTGLLIVWFAYLYRMRQVAEQINIRIDAQVNERTRIARELHDTLLQSFNGLLLRFQTASNLLPARPEEAKKRIDSAIEQAAVAVTEGRDAVHGLRSAGLVAVELAESIGNLARELLGQPSSGGLPEFQIQVEGSPKELNPVVRDEVYRLAAEALRNAIRHAGAKRIEVEIRYDAEELKLRVRDDGRGIDAGVLDKGHAPGHWGLGGMRERARLIGASFEIWSKPGSGTEIELKIPAASAYAKPVASRGSLFSRTPRA